MVYCAIPAELYIYTSKHNADYQGKILHVAVQDTLQCLHGQLVSVGTNLFCKS